MPRITLHTLDGREVSYSLEREVTTIGRGSKCDIVVHDARASRDHATLRHEDGAFVLIDRTSQNGTRVNGQRLRGQVTLRTGDRIEIGSLRLVFRDATDEELVVPTDASAGMRRDPASTPETGWPVGTSPAMQALRAGVLRVAPTAATVLLSGESGTGKELVARLLHRLSPRTAGPFEVVNCPALPPSLLESELFGVERGAATGVSERRGKLERADGGTLFLDEVGDLDPAAQAKLLRFLQDRVVERVGGRSSFTVDVRVVAATNVDLEEAIGRGAFRRDLFHRLNVVALHLPPLRDRPEDIAELAAHILGRRAGAVRELSPEALAHLVAHDFPGNVRELEHVLESASIQCDGIRIELGHLPAALLRGGSGRTAPSSSSAGGASDLYQRVVGAGESFWSVVRTPYVDRKLDRRAVSALLIRLYRETGGSHKRAAEKLGLGLEDYKRFLDFVRYHRLRVRDLLTAPSPES